MARKTTKQEESLEQLFDDKVVDQSKLTVSREITVLFQKISEEVEKSMSRLVAEVEPMVEQIMIISEENKNLKLKWTNRKPS